MKKKICFYTPVHCLGEEGARSHGAQGGPKAGYKCWDHDLANPVYVMKSSPRPQSTGLGSLLTAEYVECSS